MSAPALSPPSREREEKPSSWVLVMKGRAERHAQERGYQRIIRLLVTLVILPAYSITSAPGNGRTSYWSR